MKQKGKYWIAALSAVFVVGCSGSDEREEAPAPAPLPAGDPAQFPITASTKSTATIVATDEAAAARLAERFQQHAEEAAQFARLGQFRVAPADVRVRTAATATYSCAQFLGDGASGKVSYSHPDTTPTAGWKATLTFNDCAYADGIWAYSVKGTVVYEYLRYVSGSDFGFRGSTDGMTWTYSENGNVKRTGTLKFNHTFDLHDGNITTSYQTPVSASWNIDMSRSGSKVTVSADSVVDLTELKEVGGVVNAKVTSWTYDISRGRSLAGSAWATGVNNTRVDVQVTETGYTVVYTAPDGKKTTYKVAHPSW